MPRLEIWKPLAGGLVTGALCLGGTLAMGLPGDFEAMDRLEAAIPTIRFLCSSLIAASASILALMLTLLGLSLDTGPRLARSHYLRVRRIARWDAFGFLGSVLFLVLLIVPVRESEQLPAGWYDVIYYGVVTLASLLAGYLSVVVLLLYDTLAQLITALGLQPEDHPLVEAEEDAEPEARPEDART